MIRLVSVNVERSRHLDTVLAFLKEVKPHVVCMQELVEADGDFFCKELWMQMPVYVPNTREKERSGSYSEHGVGLLCALPFSNVRKIYYDGDPSSVPVSDETDPDTFNNANRAIVSADIEHEGELMRIATTHFTWSPRGEATDLQRANAQKLLEASRTLGEHVLCGDFNAPRRAPEGHIGEIFSIFAKEYKDNIPEHYLTSIDLELHRASRQGKAHEIADKMVDMLFATPAYKASNVQLISGVSDHCAIFAEISKA